MRKLLLLLVACLVLAPHALASGPERLHIDSIGLDAPVEAVGYEVIEYEGKTAGRLLVPAAAVGRYDAENNVILMGHNPGVFGDLWRVKLGDTITLGNTYTVTDKRLLPDHAGLSYAQRERNGRVLLPTSDERVTLVTCWGKRWRLVVVAR